MQQQIAEPHKIEPALQYVTETVAIVAQQTTDWAKL
jgi:hypothetical protein